MGVPPSSSSSLSAAAHGLHVTFFWDLIWFDLIFF
jgi:hypothetical protein